MIDSKLNLFKFKSGYETEDVSRTALEDYEELALALDDQVRDKMFMRIGIVENCISILGKSYNL